MLSYAGSKRLCHAGWRKPPVAHEVQWGFSCACLLSVACTTCLHMTCLYPCCRTVGTRSKRVRAICTGDAVSAQVTRRLMRCACLHVSSSKATYEGLAHSMRGACGFGCSWPRWFYLQLPHPILLIQVIHNFEDVCSNIIMHIQSICNNEGFTGLFAASDVCCPRSACGHSLRKACGHCPCYSVQCLQSSTNSSDALCRLHLRPSAIAI